MSLSSPSSHLPSLHTRPLPSFQMRSSMDRHLATSSYKPMLLDQTLRLAGMAGLAKLNSSSMRMSTATIARNSNRSSGPIMTMQQRPMLRHPRTPMVMRLLAQCRSKSSSKASCRRRPVNSLHKLPDRLLPLAKATAALQAAHRWRWPILRIRSRSRRLAPSTTALRPHPTEAPSISRV